ncbi:MAG: excinuclease ABC subunit UvrA [Calditrichia bacterium]
MKNFIEIRGARLHNLKNIDLRIPRGKLVVITGPSGSGKSTLAFDTLYAEGQRRYVESLSAYTRQFLEKMPKPEVDYIGGIGPAIAIQQKAPSGNPRSTVGTVTEIYDYLRLLYARIAEIYCYRCGTRVKRDLPEDVLAAVEQFPAECRFYLAFPVSGDLPVSPDKFAEYLKSEGFLRVWQNGQVLDIRKEKVRFDHQPTYVVVDRLSNHSNLDRARLMDSVQTAFHHGEGGLVLIEESGRIHRFNQLLECSSCGTRTIEPQPRLFSFNNPFGACPGCQGFGDMMDFDMNKIVPDPGKSLRQGAIAPWTTPAYRHMMSELAYVARKHGIDMNRPFRDLPEPHKQYIEHGGEDFWGIRGFFEWLETKKYKVHVRVFISRYRSYFTCTRCHGARLRPEALAMKLGGKSISELTRMNIADLLDFFQKLKLTDYQQKIAEQLLKEITKRLQYLVEVGLDYLHLDRRANTLSGGEFQRINLATALGSALTGTLYVLDEPTVGLHPRDTHRLIKILKSLVALGNTVVVVEHDRAVMEKADHIIDLGPAAGEQGGQVMFQGKYADLLTDSRSITALYLRGEKTIPVSRYSRGDNLQALKIIGAAEHNLKNIDVRIPLNRMVCITGVSGSGKSTLVEDVLYRAYLAHKGQMNGRVGRHREIQGWQYIERIELVDQSPIGRTPRSNPVTYIKAFDEIRKVLAQTPQARIHGFTPGRFSFNVPGGRCESCQGDGQIKIEMQFLADVYIECEACKGKRFKPEILNIYFRGKNVVDILNMTVDEAVEFFKDHPRVVNKLKILQSVGLGYLRMGQPATTLSGGEAQRVKIAAHLSSKSHQNTLFIFDEPTTGLHMDEISKLLHAFDLLLQRGASLLVVEHNPDVILHADWIIDLGPEGGARGGYIVAQGTPRQILEHSESHTARFLRAYVEQLSKQEMALTA